MASQGHTARSLQGLVFPFEVKKESPSPTPTVVVKKSSPSPSPVVVKKVITFLAVPFFGAALRIEV